MVSHVVVCFFACLFVLNAKLSCEASGPNRNLRRLLTFCISFSSTNSAKTPTCCELHTSQEIAVTSGSDLAVYLRKSVLPLLYQSSGFSLTFCTTGWAYLVSVYSLLLAYSLCKNWSTAMDGYQLFRKDRQGGRGSGVGSPVC